jgi:predicted RNA-binding protein with RPS1 domain
MKCYDRDYPVPGEFVVVRIASITDMGAYASLLEYDNIQGMIPLDELSVRKSSRKLVVADKLEVALVLSVDVQKGYIDLSKKRVSLDDVLKTCERWHTAKAAKAFAALPVSATIDVIIHRGSDHLKEALLYGLAEDGVEVRMDQSPSYHIRAASNDVLSRTCSEIMNKIHLLGGNAILK